MIGGNSLPNLNSNGVGIGFCAWHRLTMTKKTNHDREVVLVHWEPDHLTPTISFCHVEEPDKGVN